MMEIFETERNETKKYLLGSLDDEAAVRRLEENIILDDAFAEQLEIAEDELIGEYLDGNLDFSERERFDVFFLRAPENREKLRLVENLRKYAASRAVVRGGEKIAAEKSVAFDWRRLFFSPPVRLAAIALLIFGAGFGIWRTVFYESEVERGMAQMRMAYRGQRPVEVRTTGNFDYAPFSAVRGDADAVADEKAHRRAERLLLDATENPADAPAHHALGLLYLTDKKFDAALKELNQALNLAPDNTAFNSDLGALYLEKAKLSERDDQGAEFLENINAGLKYLDRALELNPNLTEALFNRAAALQKIPALDRQAVEAWKRYLEKDSVSPWADEARRQIQKIESQKSPNLSADAVEKSFLEAFRRRDRTEAGRLISQNRELIKGKYLPQKLAVSFLESTGGERAEYLQALIFTGDLERDNIGDSFAGDLAAFYQVASAQDLELLKQAQASVKNSYRLCLEGKIGEALEESNRARRIFLQVGDVYEARLCEFLIVYCSIKNNAAKNSLPVAEEIAEFCRRKNYKWLLSNTLYWQAGAQRSLGDRARAAVNYKSCLGLAEETADPQILQKILVTLANQNKFVGQNKIALNYLQKALSGASGVTLREKWRTSSDSIELLASLKLYNLAKAVSLENIQLARDSEDASFVSNSQLDAGILYTQTGEFDAARTLLAAAEQNAANNLEGADRTEFTAKSRLTSSYLERKLENYPQSAKYNAEALRAVENSEVPFFLYEIQKSRLLTDIAANERANVEEQINKTIDLAETYRTQISEEQSRNSFFNDQQDIYDIAVGYEFERANYERAYDYLEKSNARSLLDWLKKGVSVNYEKERLKNIENAFGEDGAPLQLNEIRRRMPEQVQILQYAVLEKKTLVWLVSKDKFVAVVAGIDAESLNRKAADYIRAVSARDAARQEEARILGRELYDLLLAPIAGQLDPSREICLIPQKILFHLPFAALTAGDGKPFLTEYNFFYAPSANVFLLCTENAAQKSNAVSETLLSVGNPRFDRVNFPDLPDLPDAEDEALTVARFYPRAQTLIGAAATETAVRDSLANAEVVNFAGHYIVKHGEPLASGLLLTPDAKSNDTENGVLTNAELINRNLPRTKLVVLSACQTGIEQYYNGEGLVGLSRTFLAAGVPLAVASHWQIDSSAAAELMKRFHFFRTEGKLSTTAALRRAQIEMSEMPDGRFRQPFYWAAFAAYGGYAEF